MNCLNFCVLGAAFLGSSVLTMLASKQSKNFKNFEKLLSKEQSQIHKGIVKERALIYFSGLVLGVLLAFLTMYFANLKPNNKVCVFIVVALGVNYLFYSLYPKSTYMIQHLNTKEQNEAWLRIYKEMKLRCKLGLLLGVIGYVLLGNGLCK